VLAVARGESVRLPTAVPPAKGNPASDDYGWILGQFALLGRTDIVRALVDAGMSVDSRGWSNFTPLDQAAIHGRTLTVRLLIERGADLNDCAFDEDGPAPRTAPIRGRSRRCSRPARPHGTRRLSVTKRSMRCSSGTRP
jgi:Ankyrin repeats (3 copies)